MFDWLQTSTFSDGDPSPWQIALRLATATVAGGLVAVIAQAAHGRRKPDAPMLMATLVLLTVLIAMVTLVIGNSVARAFGLVGALSIVRFRTVVNDTRDTAFVIFAVIVGMALGAGAYLVPVIGIPLVGTVAILLDRLQSTSSAATPSHHLTIRLGLGRDPAATYGHLLERYTSAYLVSDSATARQGAAIDIGYDISLNDARMLPNLVAELNQIDGVQAADAHRLST